MADQSLDPKQEQEVKKIVKLVLEEQEKQQNGEEKPGGQQLLQKCIIDCANAHNLCLQTLNYCLSRGGNFTDPANFKVIQDCSELCGLNVSFLLRDSPLKSEINRNCQAACEACVAVCEKFQQDEQMKTCGKYASICKDSCGQLLSTLSLQSA